MAHVGLNGIEFVCPSCSGRRWVSLGGIKGACETPRCTFAWSRRHDFRVFREKSSGAGFASPLELEAAIGPPPSSRAGQLYVIPMSPLEVASRIFDLLAVVMVAPPTVAVIERWSTAEKAAALKWASREVLVDDDVAVERVARPAFIEERAATA